MKIDGWADHGRVASKILSSIHLSRNIGRLQIFLSSNPPRDPTNTNLNTDSPLT